MQLTTRQARNMAILVTVGIFVVMLVAIGVGQLRRDEARMEDRRSATSCELTQAMADDIMVDYLRAHQAEDTTRMTKLRSGTISTYPGCAPAVYSALGNWMDAVNRGDQAAMTRADEQLITALR
jgi:hypothetical protein